MQTTLGTLAMELEVISTALLLNYIYMLRAKRGFAQSRDCPAQTLDPWFVVQTMDWPRNPGITRAQSLDQDNPGIALRKA